MIYTLQGYDIHTIYNFQPIQNRGCHHSPCQGGTQYKLRVGWRICIPISVQISRPKSPKFSVPLNPHVHALWKWIES